LTELLEAEHLSVPADLLELYEVLEYVGQIESPPFQNAILSVKGTPPPAKFIPRVSWGAKAATGRTGLTTARGNTAHWEGPGLGDYPHTSCATKLRGIQKYHMEHQGWNDIAYSDVTCRHGFIFEGRWYGWRTAANGTNTGNDRSYAHCVLMGEGDEFTVDARRGLRNVFEWYEARGSGTERHVHADWKQTACPGGAVMQFVRGGMVISEPTPPTPAPPAWLTLLSSEEIDMQLNTYDVIVGTGSSGPYAGFGWVRLPWSKTQIKGALEPGLRPEADQKYQNAKLGFAADDLPGSNGTILSVEGWAPGWPAHVQVSVTE
jgi:hypothetical protein